ncbi:MAG: AraC family transcriptional regulator [Azospirillaceae bacterium]|nr:AraC family transcriptional regulator [Azospirillaceae bacterium]
MSDTKPFLEVAENSPGNSFRFIRHGIPYPFVNWHFHPEFEIHQIIRTSGKLFIGDSVHSFRPGSLFLIGPYTPHNFVSNAPIDTVIPERDLVIQFKKEWIEASATLLAEFQNFRPLFEDAIFGVEYNGTTLQNVYKLMNKIDSVDVVERLVCFIRILDAMLKCPQKNILGTSSYFLDTRTTSLRKFHNVVDYIHGHIDEDIPMEIAARLVNMSYKTFSRWFLECTGIGFRKYVIKIRIRKSCEYLFSTQRSIQEICFMVGFNNVSNYNRLFKEIVGMTPSEFKKKSIEAKSYNFLREGLDED